MKSLRLGILSAAGVKVMVFRPLGKGIGGLHGFLFDYDLTAMAADFGHGGRTTNIASPEIR